MKRMLSKGLIVSCQALRHEPLFGGDTIPKMALAAQQGGAVGIRANTVRDINAIWKYLHGALPIIGLIKRDYPDSSVYITPTQKEARALIRSKCDIIALDATTRTRPNGETLESLVTFLRANTDKPLMADIADLDDAAVAERLGFDYISTTLRSYTESTQGVTIPDIDFCRALRAGVKNAVLVAEGGIHTYDELLRVLETGIEHVVIGGTITRPQNITQGYVQVFAKAQGL